MSSVSKQRQNVLRPQKTIEYRLPVEDHQNDRTPVEI